MLEGKVAGERETAQQGTHTRRDTHTCLSHTHTAGSTDSLIDQPDAGTTSTLTDRQTDRHSLTGSLTGT
jgi:hypothetical protein